MASAGTCLTRDDDFGIRETLAPALSPATQGHPAGRAAAVSEGLCTHPFDLVLLDYRPPGLQAITRFFPHPLVLLIVGIPRRSAPPAQPPPSWGHTKGRAQLWGLIGQTGGQSFLRTGNPGGRSI